MKKILSVFLTVSLLFCLVTMSSFAASQITTDSSGINCVDFLDFSSKTNDWAKFNEETGEWESAGLTTNPKDEDQMTAAAFLSNQYSYLSYLNWSLVDDGEVLRLTAKDTNNTAGVPFVLDSFASDIKVGTEAAGQAEFVKIRIRNNSSSTKIGFGFTMNWTTNVTRSISLLDIEPNMTGWTTYTFSIRDLNYNTNYSKANTPETTWAGSIRDFIVFPFGYGNQSNIYEGASIDIDYIVIGSEEYVTNYKSTIEEKEDSVVSFEPITLPEKTTYYMGDRLDLSGFSAKITYSDGTDETVDYCNATYNFDNEGKTTVTLRYGRESFTYDVNVIGVSDIEIATQPEEPVYRKIDVMRSGFTPVGLTVKVNFKDGTSMIKELGSFDLQGTTFKEAGDYVVTVNFYGSTTTFPVKITDIESIDFYPLFQKLYYGTTLTADMFDIECRYTDHSSNLLKEVGLESSLTIECDTAIAGGEVTAHAVLRNETYGINLEKDFKLKVETPTSLNINSNSAVKRYRTDAMLDTTNLIVSYAYEDGTKAEIDITNPSVKIKYDFSGPGETQVKIAVGELSSEYKVTVRDPEFNIEPTAHDGTVQLLKAKFPTGAIVAIVFAVIIVVFGGLFCYLKFVKKVSFKRKRKRVSLDDIF